MSRRSLLTDIDSAVDQLSDGDTLCLGGFLTSHQPMWFVREVVRRDVTGLTLVSPPASLETDLLVAAGCVETVIAPYVGAERIAPIAPWFRHLVEEGEVQSKESDGGLIVAALEAAERDLPFMPWLGGVGTDIPDLHDELVVFDDPIEGRPVVAVPAIEPDVAFLHCARADRFGNVQAIGDTFADGLIARASKQTFVQVEEVVSNDEVRQTPHQTLASFGNIDGIVEAPWGAHPFSCEGYYLADVEWLEQYVENATGAIDDDATNWNKFLDQYVRGPTDHTAYLDVIGLSRLTDLAEYGGGHP